MSNGVVSIRYAKALSAFASERGEDGQVYISMQRFMSQWRAVPSLKTVLMDPTVSVADKCSLLEASASQTGETVPGSLKRFFELVVKAGRVDLMVFMAASYIDLYKKEHNIVSATLTVATPGALNCKHRLEPLVENVCGDAHSVEWEEKVDSSLMGGFVLQVDGFRMDSSVAYRLGKIKKELIEKNNRLI